jgi:putative FmdB family regulatory protein
MPIYEYECRQCGEEFEHLVMASSSGPSCPSCRSDDLERKLSACAVDSEQTRGRFARLAKARRDEHRREWSHQEHQRFHSHDH